MANWPWPRRISPFFEGVKAESDEWFRSFNALSPKSLKAFEKCDFARLAALAYPDASREHLRIACDLMIVYFIVDEYTDVEDANRAAEIVNVIIDALNNPHRPRPEGEMILGEVVRQSVDPSSSELNPDGPQFSPYRFWSRAIQSASPTAQRHFLDDYITYLRAVIVEAGDRDKSVTRDIQGYLSIRRQTVGAQSAFVIFELGLNLVDEVYYHPAVTELIDCVAELILIDNDLASYNREQGTGDENHNLVTAIMFELGLDRSGAMSWAAAYHAEIEARFINGLLKLPSWGPTLDAQIKEYLNGIANWARANYCWSYEGQRYFGNRGGEIEKTRLVPLLSKARRDPKMREKDIVVADLWL
ncbi:terpenoid synthase [Pisolithus thermaeus]|nr:terpenoid synthase [Pisolithus thermaeus]